MKRTIAWGLLLVASVLLLSNFRIMSVAAETRSPHGLTFLKHSVDSTPTSVGMLVAVDLDGDQDLDFISNISSAGYKLVWWENDGTPADGSWTQYTIGTSTTWISEIAAADMDGDLDFDMVMSSNAGSDLLWYENDGTPLDGGWTQHDIGSYTFKSFYEFAAADLDGDGDMDVAVNTNTNKRLEWYENDGTPKEGNWPYYLIYSNCDECKTVRAVDINLDNRIDILITADDNNLQDNDTLYFLTHNADGTWTRHLLEESWNIWEADAGDIDGDGDMDVAAALQNGAIHWWENNGGAATTWPHHRVVPSPFNYPGALQLVDLDQDGDLDILGTSADADEFAWFENDGTPVDGDWIWHTIENGYESPGYARAADVDGDGDRDILGEASDGGIFWWEQNLMVQVLLPFVIKP